jgi:hypothetical protein
LLIQIVNKKNKKNTVHRLDVGGIIHELEKKLERGDHG